MKVPSVQEVKFMELKRSADTIVSPETALDTQVGGSHYKNYKIQPLEFCQKNQLNYCESNAIKYLCRHRSKGGAEDLRKAIHYIRCLLEIEYEDDGV